MRQTPTASFLKTLTILAFASLSASAQAPTPPPQPVTGPGGSTYLYPSNQQFGPYYANPAQPQPYETFFVFEPSGASPPASLPVVLFLHAFFLKLQGDPAGDTPSNYTYWIQHLNRKGYTVVFATYDSGSQLSQYTSNIVTTWQAALALLQSGTVPGLIPPASDSAGLQTVFTGHSLGAVESFAVAEQLTINGNPAVPAPRAIAAFQPGIGQSGQLSTSFPRIGTGLKVILLDGDQDVNDIPAAQAIWNSVSNSVPVGNRDFLEVISDSHGSPAQIGNHWYPDTNGFLDDDSGIDARDFYITWKLSTGLFNCAISGNDCSYGLGHGSPDQVSMGSWSDGTAVTPLSLLSVSSAAPAVASVTDAASFSSALAPGELATIFGSNFTSGAAGSAPAIPLPPQLDGVTVKVNGTAVPLLYVSPTQVNFQIPYELGLGTAQIAVSSSAGTSASFPFAIQATAPSLFQYNGNNAVVDNSDFTLNQSTNPATPGDFIVAYATGSGAVTNQPADGSAAAANPLSAVVVPLTQVSATINGENAPVTFAGLAPGFVGLLQLNITVPSDLTTGAYPLIVKVGAASSTPANISVK